MRKQDIFHKSFSDYNFQSPNFIKNIIFQSLGTTVINQFTISDNISPMFPTGNPELALSFIFWLYWLCKAKTSSKLGKSCSTRSLDMIPDSKSGRKNKRSSTFKLRTWLFSVWKNSENIISKLGKTHKILENMEDPDGYMKSSIY